MLDMAKLDRAARRGGDVATAIGRLREADNLRVELQKKLDGLRAQRNGANQGMAKMDKSSAEFATAREELKTLSHEIKTGEHKQAELEVDRRSLHLEIPNGLHASVPAGKGEEDNVLHSVWGEPPVLDFTAKPHWEVGENLGILDFERAAKIAGARFCVLKGAGARLARALIQMMLDVHTSRGYLEVWPPAIVHQRAMEGTGQLPKFAHDAFRVAGESEFFLSPTAEVQVTNMHREEILEPGTLPLSYAAYAACFRAEAGTYGRDTRGIIRQHQFDKVELVRFCEPDSSYELLEVLRDDAEEILRRLELHYRVMTLCSGDIGFSAAKTYDLEVWLPSENGYREISSCSNFEDFQARRASIRYRPKAKTKPKHVHTLNGSGLAVGRTIVAILEQYQTADGGVRIPDALAPYMGGIQKIEPQ